MEPLVYWNVKFSHSGITGYKVFEGFDRKIHHNSLKNLLNRKESLNDLNNEMKEQDNIIIDNIKPLKKTRNLSIVRSKKCRNYCQKLCYYSATRKFESKKSGKYSFKIAFITLTTPAGIEPQQSLKAFNKFLDYLRRTANCVYVWKKELGENNGKLHYHILVNNFIPYYIVSWKWKKLLIGEGVIWPTNNDGKETSSHYRIELPRKMKKVNYYISKYLAKGTELPIEYGYIWGKSELLDSCKEFSSIAEDLPYNEVIELKNKYKTITTDYLTHICVNLLKVKEIAPNLYDIVLEQYLRFQSIITLNQRFVYV